MYEKIYDQAEQVFKPFSEVMAINVKTLESLREKQVDMVNRFVADTLEHVSGLADKKTVESVCSAQKDYWQSIQNEFADNAKSYFALLSDSQEQIVEQVQQSAVWSELPIWGEWACKNTAPAPVKKSTIRKPTAKKKTPVTKDVSTGTSA